MRIYIHTLQSVFNPNFQTIVNLNIGNINRHDLIHSFFRTLRIVIFDYFILPFIQKLQIYQTSFANDENILVALKTFFNLIP